MTKNTPSQKLAARKPKNYPAPGTITGNEPTHAEAMSAVVEQERHRATVLVRAKADRVERARASLARARTDYENTVAALASTEPTREDWYEYPGALPRKNLLDAARLSSVALHRLMEKHRANAPKKSARKR